jgi:hypothetical protein
MGEGAMFHVRLWSAPALLLAACATAQAQNGAPQLPGSMAAPLQKSRDAIMSCRERRERKEIATYRESAVCASPIIFAAWRDAGYQHMDLITEWLNVRESASAQVDQKALTPAQFEQQMDDLTRRLTIEERRRRIGLISTPDGALQLQLPPSTKVTGVATPPGEEKQAKKKSEAARTAATLAYAEPGITDGMQAIGSLSALDAVNTAAGGPLVAAPPSLRVAANGQPPQGASGIYAHLASLRSEPEAYAAFRFLQQQYPTVLNGRDAVVRRVDGAEGTFYRVEVGPFGADQTRQFCGSLRAAGAQCVARSE